MLEIEEGLGILTGEFTGLDFRLRVSGEVDEGEPGVDGGMDDLAEFLVDGDEGGAQGFVTLDQGGEGVFERLGIDRAFEQEGVGHAVGGGTVAHLGKHPQAALGMRDGIVGRIGDLGDGGIGGRSPGDNLPGQFFDGGLIENLPQGDLDP